MKKLYLWLLAAVTIFCIFVGTAHHAGGLFRGRDVVVEEPGKVLWEGGTGSGGKEDAAEKGSGDEDASAENEEAAKPGEDAAETGEDTAPAESSGSAENAADASEAAQPAESVQISAVTRIEIEAERMDVVIRPGNETKASYSGKEELSPEIREENGVLRITQKSKIDLINFTGRSVLTVTLAEDISLESLQADLNLGDFDMRQIRCGVCTAHTDMGDLNVEKCSLGDTVLSTDMGDVDVEECTFGNLTATSCMGDVEISSTEDLSDRSIELLTSLGEVEVNEKEYGKQFTQKAAGERISAQTDMGDVDLTYPS